MAGLALRLRRQFDFARHVPPGRILRRGQLALRRRLERRLRPRLDPGPLIRAERPPLALAPAPAGEATRTEKGWRFTFIGRTVDMAPDVDWRAPGPGPRDQLWRMNLHYMDYLEALPDAGTQALIESWIAANPPYAPGSASDSWNAYALSLRVVAWMKLLAARAGRLDAGFAAAAEASLAEQLAFLERHLERDVGGNHLVKNVKALIWGAAYFTGRAADRWRRLGLGLLRRELPRQILPDGVHYERSPSYHAQVLLDLLEIRHLLGVDPFGGALDRALGAMARALADLTHPDGTPALFNDSGLHMGPAPADCLSAYRALFGEAPAPRASFDYPEGGYYGWRGDAYYLVADFGRIGPDDLPAHAHGDIGSIELSVGGERLIVDPGVYEYVEGERRARSRSAAAHNVLAVDGADQAEFFGAFRCGRRPGVEAAFRPDPDGLGFVLDGRHDGYAHRGGPTAHRRIAARPGTLTIEDWLEGGGGRSASLSFLLHPEARARPVEGGILIARGAVEALLVANPAPSIEADVWWPDMGVELATSRIRLLLPTGDRRVRCEFRLPGQKGSN